MRLYRLIHRSSLCLTRRPWAKEMQLAVSLFPDGYRQVSLRKKGHTLVHEVVVFREVFKNQPALVDFIIEELLK